MNRPWLIIIIALLLAPLGVAQTAPISGQIISQYGQPVPGAQVYICNAATSTGLPCSPVASIFSDYNLTQPTANPTIADANGNFNVYVGALAFPNIYVVNAIANTGGTPYTWLYPGPSGGGGLATGCSSTPVGNLTCSGTITGGVVSAANLASVGPWYDTTQWGAAESGYATTGTVNVSSNPNLMTVASNTGFASGQEYTIPGAGVAGANLVVTVTNVSGDSISFTPPASTSVNGVTIDDTLGIQAAFNACWNGGNAPNGGTVYFPGNHTSVVSGTLYMYDTCKIDGGQSGGLISKFSPVFIHWNGSAPASPIAVTSFTSATNVSTYPASSPSAQGNLYPDLLTFPTTTPPAVNTFMLLNGFTGTAINCNRNIGQITSVVAGTSFTMVSTCASAGTYTDTGTATPINVTLATDYGATDQVSISHIAINVVSGLAGANYPGVNILYAGYAQSGVYFFNTWSQAATWFDYYFMRGGEQVYFDGAWRADGGTNPGGAQIYWKVSNFIGHLALENGYMSIDGLVNSQPTGAQVMLDNGGCTTNSGPVNYIEDHMGHELIVNMAQGTGLITLIPCTTATGPSPQFILNGAGNYLADNGSSEGFNGDSIVETTPVANSVSGAIFGSAFSVGQGNNQSWPFVGIPGISKTNTIFGTNDISPSFNFCNNYFSALGFTSQASMCQFTGDVGMRQLFQYTLLSAPLLESDAAFAALPNETTLVPGQVLAPPAYWKASGKRYALDVVTVAGTTGSISTQTVLATSTGGTVVTAVPTNYPLTATSCTSNVLTATIGTNTLNTGGGDPIMLYQTAESFLNGPTSNGAPWPTSLSATATTVSVPFQCGSFTGNASDTGYVIVPFVQNLDEGQWIETSGGSPHQIKSFNAVYPLSITINMLTNFGVVSTPTALAFVPPTLGLEMQLPTKTAAAPSTLAWSEGDVEQMTGAAANGPCLLVNVAAGTPGTWAEVPCGNSAGLLTGAQVSAGSQSTLPVCFNGTSPVGSLTSTECSGISPVNATSLVTAPTAGGVGTGTYTSGITATGSATQTCDLTFSNGGTATVPLTGTNTIATGTAYSVTAASTSTYLFPPTTAVVSSGTATCSGTPVLLANLTSSVIGTGSGVTVYTTTVPTLSTGQCVAYTAYWERTGAYNGVQYAYWSLAGNSIQSVNADGVATSGNLIQSTIHICNNPGVTNAQSSYLDPVVTSSSSPALVSPAILATALNFTSTQTLVFQLQFPNTDYYNLLGLKQNPGN